MSIALESMYFLTFIFFFRVWHENKAELNRTRSISVYGAPKGMGREGGRVDSADDWGNRGGRKHEGGGSRVERSQTD